MIDSLAIRRRLGIRDGSLPAITAIAALVAVYYFGAFLYIALRRLHYPFALDWVEGESLIQVARLLKGQMLYIRPSYEYVALTYPPLYYYVSALVARSMGLELAALRLVSLIASLGCMVLIYLICRREGTRVVPAVLASGFFAATYQLSGTWFDVARIDMLATVLVLCAIYFMARRTTVSYVIAGLCLALACLTKQTNILSLLVLCVYVIVLERRALLPFGLASLGSLILTSLLLDRYYSGWYRFFTLTSAFGSNSSPAMTPSMVVSSIPDFWLHGILEPLPIISVLMIAYALAMLGIGLKIEPGPYGRFLGIRIVRQIPASDDLRRTCFYIFCAAGLLGTSWGSIAHQGSFNNDLIPAFAIEAIFLGLGIQHFCFGDQPGLLRRNLALGACILQLILLYYPIGAQIPTLSDLRAGQALLTEIREQPGEVYVLFHPELALMAGKQTYASWDSMFQLEGNYGGGDIEETRRVKAEMSNAMARHKFSMIILDKDLNWVWGHPEKYYYMRTDPVFDRSDVFWPVTGWPVRPTWVMFPKSP